ncbi:glycoside hydrolase [Bombardia bombarda]|uniref:alpha-1,2-Mannosidase n=1 Tax=Bombardia bombarda TaxID=252184 RepID=A0AA39X1F8_9PEZI|nr:glycoside hydrolase [Bombardia bombarda]
MQQRGAPPEASSLSVSLNKLRPLPVSGANNFALPRKGSQRTQEGGLLTAYLLPYVQTMVAPHAQTFDWAAHAKAPHRFIAVAVAVVITIVAVTLLGVLLPRRSAAAGAAQCTSKNNVCFQSSSFVDVFGFDLASAPQWHPVSTIQQLPVATPTLQALNQVQHDFINYVHHNKSKARQDAVRAAFVRSWNSYKKHAWLQDELTPVTGAGKTTFGGWAATLVDSLDTLWIMGLQDDFYTAAAAAARIDWAKTDDTGLNVFETTIRHLGGLLSAYDLSSEHALLEKATELANMLYMAFDTPNRLPAFWLDFGKAKQGLQTAGLHDPSAAPCSLSLEFTRLAQLTADSRFYDAISRVTDFLERTQSETKLPGMWPKWINFRNERVDGDSAFSLGAESDSLYEYLLKMAALLNGQSPRYETMYRAAMNASVNHLLFRPMIPDEEAGKGILFMGNAYAHDDRIDRISESQHLSCFTGGMFGLGGKLFDIPDHVDIGERLARGCAWAYSAFPTGLMPEVSNIMACDFLQSACSWDEQKWWREGNPWLTKGFTDMPDPRYNLRPEAIESLFLLYRITGKEDLRDIAWTMFNSVMNATKTEFANSAITDVTVDYETKKLDSMESFWMAETLKYFYLMFSPPELISLDEFVFSTEAHPFRLPQR